MMTLTSRTYAGTTDLDSLIDLIAHRLCLRSAVHTEDRCMNPWALAGL
jgi:hypothetical protein